MPLLLALIAAIGAPPAKAEAERLPVELVYATFAQFTNESPRLLTLPIPMYFSIENQDPSPQLVWLLEEMGLTPLPGSQHESGRAGALVKIDRVGPSQRDAATVKIGLHVSGGSGTTYKMELHDGTWIAVSRTNSWMR